MMHSYIMSLPQSRAKVTSESQRKILEGSVTTVLILYGLPWEMGIMTRGELRMTHQKLYM